MGVAKLEISSNIQDLLTKVDGLSGSMKHLTNETEQYTQRSNGAYKNAATSIDTINKGIKLYEGNLKKLTLEYLQLSSNSSKLTSSEKKHWQEVNDKINETKKNISELKSRQADLGGETSKGAALFSKLGGIMAATFATGAIINYSKEALELAGRAEGIEEAFRKLNDPALLDKLREATRGTVSDVELMKNAVKANNFKIPLEQLATFFEFATKRAAQTGESVDYLVESIILGVGRKSPLILDNLGISAIALREKFKGVSVESASIGDVSKAMGELVEEELTKMGDVSLTTKQKMEQLKVSTESIKESWGKVVVEIVRSDLGNWFQDTLSKIAGGLKIINELGADAADWGLWRNIWRGSDALNGLGDQMDRFNEGLKSGTAEMTRRLELSDKPINEIKQGLIDAAEANIKFNEENKNFAALQYWKAYKKSVEEYTKTTKDANNTIIEEVVSLDSLKAKLAEVEKKQSSAPLAQFHTFDTEIKLLKEQIALYEKKDKAAAKTASTIEQNLESLQSWIDKENKLTFDVELGVGGTQTAEEYQKQIDENLKGFDLTMSVTPEFSTDDSAEAQAWDDAYDLMQDNLAGFEQAQQEAWKKMKKFAEDHPLAEAMGFENEEQLEQAKDYAGQLLDFANQIIDQQVQATERLVEDQNQRIEEQQSLVDKEYADKQAGLANSYELEAANLKKMQAERDKAIKDRERMIKIQQTMSTVESGIALVSAAANIIKGFSSIPVVGVVLGLAAVAAMVAGFILMSNKAKDATKMEHGGRAKYGLLDGKRHTQGGIDINAEEGEFFVNRNSTAKHLPLLEAINRDDRESMKLYFDRNFMAKYPERQNEKDYTRHLQEIARNTRGKKETIYGPGFIREQIGGYTKIIHLN